MQRFKIICVMAVIAGSMLVGDSALARGGRGGGGGGGRGGGARPSPSMNRSPSMSRAAPSSRPVNRSSTANRASAPNRSSTANRASTANRSSAGNRSGQGTRNTNLPPVNNANDIARSFNQPSQSQVQNFLNLPSNSNNFSGQASRSSSNRGNSGSRTITTDNGTTITIGGAGGSGQTAGGVDVAGGAAGIKVEGSEGQTYVKGSAGIAASDGTNSAVRAGSVRGAQNAAGERAVNVRGGYADSSGYRQAGSVTAVQGKHGYTAVNARGAYGNGAGTGRAGSVSALRGPYGGVVSAGHGAAFVNGQFVGGQAWQAVNGNFTHWNCYTNGWYGQYPGCWWPGKWALASTAWANATWATAGAYCGCEGDPMYYDYGENVTYEDGTVYSGDEAVATADQYYDEATQIAESGENAANEEWLPLGVFAVISEEGQTKTDKVAQIALNKEGVIRGNLHDVLADKVLPITGAVDKETQRVALKLEGNDTVVVETGLYNLTNDEVPVLVHFSPEKQESRTLIRLQQPEEDPNAPELP